MALSIDLEDRVALITGVTSGIGAGVAAELAAAGCHVSGCGTSEAESAGATDFATAVERHGRQVHYRKADVTIEDELEHLVETTGERFGRIDVLVSNAGRNAFEGATDCDLDTWEACMDLDLKAHWRVAQKAKKWMDRAEHPVVLIITSNHAFSTIPGCFPYNVAKAGLTAMVQSLAVEWGPQYRAVGIAPGFIDTPINDAWFDTFDEPEHERRSTEARHPVGKLGTVEEIGGLCAFLASRYAGFVSGTTLLADGGRSALMQDGPSYR